MTAVPDATVEQDVDRQSADDGPGTVTDSPVGAPAPDGGRSRPHVGSVAGVMWVSFGWFGDTGSG